MKKLAFPVLAYGGKGEKKSDTYLEMNVSYSILILLSSQSWNIKDVMQQFLGALTGLVSE